jgi:hypothetical protein
MKQASLFEGNNSLRVDTLIKVATDDELSKENSDFQKKVLKIEKMQKDNASLRARIEDIRIQLAEALVPLSDKFCDLRVKSLEVLDDQVQKKYFRVNEKNKIKGLIIEGSMDLIEIFRDERGKKFYDKYSDLSFDEQEETTFEGIKTLFENMSKAFGFEDCEDGPSRPKKKRKKTRAERHEDEINLESKSIYRDLMKNLHPDLEQDEMKHKEKTEAVQKVSAAYKKNDVYELLKLRSKFLNKSIDQTDLKLYVTELNKKIRELDHEKYQIKTQYGEVYEKFYSKSPKVVTRRINSEKKGLEQQIQIELEHVEIFKDKGRLRTFLKEEVRLVKESSQNLESRMLDAFFGN